MIEPNTLPDDLPAYNPREGFGWWERMRWIFNLAVGLVGVAVIIANARYWMFADMIGLVVYGLFANLFYLLGFWLEMVDQHFLKGRLGLIHFRLALFLIGTGGSMLLTGFAVWAYYVLHDPMALLDFP